MHTSSYLEQGWVITSHSSLCTVITYACLSYFLGLVTPHGDTDLGLHLLKQWLNASQHQAIIWTNVDFSLVRFCGIHPRAISQCKPKQLFCMVSFKNLTYELTVKSSRNQWVQPTQLLIVNTFYPIISCIIWHCWRSVQLIRHIELDHQIRVQFIDVWHENWKPHKIYSWTNKIHLCIADACVEEKFDSDIVIWNMTWIYNLHCHMQTFENWLQKSNITSISWFNMFGCIYIQDITSALPIFRRTRSLRCQ